MTDQIDQDKLAQAMRTATHEVFATMLGLELEAGPSRLDSGASGPSSGVVALVGLAGPWVGTGSFTCSAEFACRLSSLMLMSEYQAVDEEVLDAVAELTNMIVGNVKTALEEELGGMWLSIPTVIFGRNFTTRSIGRGEWTVVPFEADGERIEVHLCLAPNREPAAQLRPGFRQPHMVQG